MKSIKEEVKDMGKQLETVVVVYVLFIFRNGYETKRHRNDLFLMDK